jgi:hypothetical protein
MAIAPRNTPRKKAAVIRRRAPQKTAPSSAKGRGKAALPTKPMAKRATRKPGRPTKSSANTRQDAVLSAQLEAISHELSFLGALRDEISDLRGGIETLTDRIESLAKTVYAGTREQSDQSNHPQKPNDPFEAGPAEGTLNLEK